MGCLAGKSGMSGAAQVIKTQVCPRQVLFRIKHTQLKACLEDTAYVHVNIGLVNESLLHCLAECTVTGSALNIGTGKDCVGRCACGILMGAVLAGVEEVANGTAVCYNQALESPLVTQYVLQQTVAGAAWLTLVTVICAHNLLHVSVLNQALECRQVGFPKVASRYAHIELMAQRLRTAVNCIVLGARVQFEVFLVIALHTLYGLGTHNGVQIRILTGSLLTASPAGITENVHVGAPE